MIFEALIIAIVLGLSNSTIILVAWDWGIAEWLQVRSPNKFFYKLFSCMFCQGIWIAAIECILLSIVYQNIYLIAVPFICGAITRKMTA